MKPVFSILLLLILHSNLFAETATPLKFRDANTAYRKGNYDTAAQLYEQVLKDGLKSGELYYNLGNSYYKTGETARAILAYERAKKFIPDDEDLAYNLRMAYSNTVDKIEPVPQLFYQRWWTQFLNLTSPGIWAILAVACIWIAAGLAAWYLYAGSVMARKITFLGSGIVLFTGLILFILAGSAYHRLHNNDGAVVMEPSAVIRSSPDEKSTTLFMLHGGTKIQVLDELGNWKQIRIANGNTGWISSTSIELI